MFVSFSISHFSYKNKYNRERVEKFSALVRFILLFMHLFHMSKIHYSLFCIWFSRCSPQENIASGFQSLFNRGDLVDVTLACDGKLLQAHKIVLAICSPYFQEMFITNPCRHPISKYIIFIILIFWTPIHLEKREKL